MQVPFFEDVLEISAEDHPTKLHVRVHNVNPDTLMHLCHESKGLD